MRAAEGSLEAIEMTPKGRAMDIDQLIRDDEVHRDVYVSEEVFALEMDRVFGSAWIYMA